MRRGAAHALKKGTKDVLPAYRRKCPSRRQQQIAYGVGGVHGQALYRDTDPMFALYPGLLRALARRRNALHVGNQSNRVVGFQLGNLLDDAQPASGSPSANAPGQDYLQE